LEDQEAIKKTHCLLAEKSIDKATDATIDSSACCQNNTKTTAEISHEASENLDDYALSDEFMRSDEITEINEINEA
jgi:hypothetical protein